MSCLSASWLGFTMVLALILDRCLGEPKHYHPLVGFGKIAAFLESLLNKGNSTLGSYETKFLGVVAWVLLCLPLPWLLIRFLLSSSAAVELATSIAVLYFCIAPRSLGEHASAIEASLFSSNLGKARSGLSRIVSRDCQNLEAEKIASGAIESTLENGSDGVLAPLFWFCLLGAPGALMYRFANTLDAMWGYRTARFIDFGFAAAKIDDCLNWVPARLCVFLYSLSGNFLSGIACWQSQGQNWSSPNAGPVMASGAGALKVQIGGTAVYHGLEEKRPLLGVGKSAVAADIGRSVGLVNKATAYLIAIVIMGELSLCYLSMVVI